MKQPQPPRVQTHCISLAALDSALSSHLAIPSLTTLGIPDSNPQTAAAELKLAPMSKLSAPLEIVNATLAKFVGWLQLAQSHEKLKTVPLHPFASHLDQRTHGSGVAFLGCAARPQGLKSPRVNHQPVQKVLGWERLLPWFDGHGEAPRLHDHTSPPMH
ncbi:hypothetical protein QQP08_014353, partial [Theobroma cacao]